jgi:pimeloyl-ACP methyl ester carboxylesterase
MVETSPTTPGSPTETTVVGGGELRLAVQDHGGPTDAPVIVLVHGYPDDHHVWDLVVERLVGSHRVVTYDVRGAGDSEVPAATAGYRLPLLVEDLVAVADAVSPDQPVHVAAHDWGSIQAWSAMTDPVASTRVASYSSMSGPGLDHVANWMQARRKPGAGRWRQAANQAIHSWYIYAFHTPLAPMAWRHGLAKRWPKMLRRSEGIATDAIWPGPGLERDAVQGIGLYRANMFRSLRRPKPVTTNVPVQLIIARRDPFVSPALLEGYEEIAPDLVRVDLDRKHWIPRSSPDDVARLVAEHVARVEAREPARTPS